MNENERKAMFRKTFDTVAEGYDNPALRFFSDSAKHLSTLIDLRGDEHIIDVATGTGNVALELSVKLPHGRVTGIDFSKSMLSRAVSKAEALNIRNVDFLEMDMQTIDFPDNYFDVAVSAFSIFFIDDMEKQLRHIAGKVKSGGRIITITFFENAFSPFAKLFLNRLQTYDIAIPPMTWKRVATEEQCVSLFKSGNMKHVRCHLKESGYYLKHASDWWHIIWNGGFRGLVGQLSPDNLQRFKSEHLEEIQRLSSDNGIWLEMNLLFTMGTKQ